jgi:hypothetical protein
VVLSIDGSTLAQVQNSTALICESFETITRRLEAIEERRPLRMSLNSVGETLVLVR